MPWYSKYNRHEQTITTELHAPNVGQAYGSCDNVAYVCERTNLSMSTSVIVGNEILLIAIDTSKLYVDM